jgi:hypothetical protein
MKLIKATQFRLRFFEPGSEPSIKTLKKNIDDGDLPGKVIGTIYYVDLDKLSKSDNPLVNRVLAA